MANLKPRGPIPDQNRVVTHRISNATWQMLQGAAKAARRSACQELEVRLLASFDRDENLAAEIAAYEARLRPKRAKSRKVTTKRRRLVLSNAAQTRASGALPRRSGSPEYFDKEI